MDRELIADIAEKCSFSTMKKEKDPMENKAEWKDGQPGMYRKGECVILEFLHVNKHQKGYGMHRDVNNANFGVTPSNCRQN